MTNTTSILVLLGSLRTGSINRQLADAVEANLPAGVQISRYSGIADGGLGDVPFYNEDIDTDEARPAGAVDLRRAVGAVDAVLIVTPEYNGSLPATVKNAIDWLSRPYGDSVIKDLPVAVIGASMSRYGGTWAHDQARKSLEIAGARVVEEATLSVPFKQLDGAHPGAVDEVVAAIRDVLGRLVAAAN